MADVMVSVPTTGSPAAAMSAVRSPATSAAVTARSIELAAFSLLSVKRRRRAALRMAPIGLATPRAARSGADPWIGSYNPRRPAPRLADGSIPSDPTSIDASSVRMSPNRFSVRTTSNAAGPLANHQQVDAADPFRLDGGQVRHGGIDPDRSQVCIQPEPLAQSQDGSPGSRRAAWGRVIPPRAADRAEENRVRATAKIQRL